MGRAPDGTPIEAASVAAIEPGTSVSPAAADPVVEAILRQATVTLAPLIVAASLRQRTLEVVRGLVQTLSNWLPTGPPPDPPPSAQPAGSGPPASVPSVEPFPRPLTIHGGSTVDPPGASYSFNTQAQDPVEPDPRAAQKLDNALSDYQTRRYTIGNQTFQFDKAGMHDVLERHAPDYWDGSQAETQTFFPKGTTVDDLQDVVEDVLSQNRDAILAAPSEYQWDLYGTSGGVRYNVGMYRGRITHLVPKQ